MKTRLDKDLEELSKGVSNNYESERALARGQALIKNIQAIRDLTRTIVSLDKQQSKLNSRILWFTIAAVILALIQLIKR